MDWLAWHRPYEEPASPLAQRLRAVQQLIRGALHQAPPGPIRAVSVCAGQGRDLLEVLANHPRAADVAARLVELDPRNAQLAKEAASQANLGGVEVAAADASITSAYAGAVPADLVLVCGVFGNISDRDVARTIVYLPRLCAPGAMVIWTRHRHSPDPTIAIRQWFARRNFAEIDFISPANTWAVGAQRFVGVPKPFKPGIKLFSFVDRSADRPAASPETSP